MGEVLFSPLGSDDQGYDAGNGNCFEINNSNYLSPRVVLPLGAAVSYVCYLYILYLRYVTKLPALSRHPTELSVYKVWFELFFVSQFFWLPFIPSNQYWNNNDDDSK
jgi:hypothetical protein